MLEKITEIIVEQLNITGVEITEDTSLKDDLGADSLDLVEILMSLEEEFNISIPDEAIPGIVTVGDLVKFIDNAKN